jgi:hypothetical protein
MRSDADGNVIGAVQLINKLHQVTRSRIPFDKHDMTLCNAIAQQIGLVMMNIKTGEQMELYSDLLLRQINGGQ